MAGETYNRLTPKMCLRLAAPHTWLGPSVLPTVFGGLYCIACGYPFSPVIWCLLLLVALFAQSSVNTLNDWADYKKGTDTIENSDDPADAVLVYDNPNPRHVLALGLGYMAVCVVIGVLCTVWAGSLVPIVIAAVGMAVIVLYSNGKLPISYLPIGEVVSGVVMGCLIPVADICILASRAFPYNGPFGLLWQLDWLHIALSTAPFVIGIGMVMATQNNCDIARDTTAGRKTLPVVLGRKRSLVLYRVFVVLWIATVLHFSFWNYPGGLWAGVVVLAFGSGCIYKMLTTPLTPEVRGPSMGTVNRANLFINGSYIVALVVSTMSVPLVLL